MLRKVILDGSLAQFGGPFVFDVSSVREAVRALTTQIRGAYRVIRDGEFTVFAKNIQLDENEVSMNLGAVDEIRIVPVPTGSKNSGVFKVILGVALLGVGFAVGVGGTISHGLLAGMTGKSFLMLGAGFMLSGIGQMISPSPTASLGDSEDASDRQSYLFNSAANITEEGNVVPVVYGQAYAGSIVISAGLSVEAVDLSLDDVTLTATGGENRITARWKAVTDAVDYQVKWTGPENGSKTTTSTSGTMTGLDAGTYTVSVRARNGSLTSKNWTSTTVTVTASTSADDSGSDEGGDADGDGAGN